MADEEARGGFATLVSMEVTIGPRPDAVGDLVRLERNLAVIGPRIVACSGGVDSLTLATAAHRADPVGTTVAHTVTPAVPGDATARVVASARREGWDLRIVRSGEFDDEAYLSNPVDRCYHCKSNLYDAVGDLLADRTAASESAVVVSGANTDDLGEYRPGLIAAAERSVRHPYVEVGISKAGVRAIARHLGLRDADLPASPCLASRLYTGTRVTPTRLRAVEAGEAMIRELTGIEVVRCRVRDDAVLVEVDDADRALVTSSVLGHVVETMTGVEPSITSVRLDADGYAPGRAFVGSGSVGTPTTMPERA